MQGWTQKPLKETGVKEYEFVASLSIKTCEICGALDGKIFKYEDAETGINCNPMHPNCHCTTVPHIDNGLKLSTTRAARDPVTGKSISVPEDMTYPEWHKKYVEDVPEAALAEKQYKNRFADKKQYDEYLERLGEKNMPKSLEDFQRIKYTNNKRWRQLMENRKLFSKIDSTSSYSPEYKAKLKQTYEYFLAEGFEFREHALNRVLGQKNSKGKFTFTNEELLSVLKKTYNYRQPDGKLIRFYNGIAVVSADDTGEIISIVVKNAVRKDWVVL